MVQQTEEDLAAFGLRCTGDCRAARARLHAWPSAVSSAAVQNASRRTRATTNSTVPSASTNGRRSTSSSRRFVRRESWMRVQEPWGAQVIVPSADARARLCSSTASSCARSVRPNITATPRTTKRRLPRRKLLSGRAAARGALCHTRAFRICLQSGGHG